MAAEEAPLVVAYYHIVFGSGYVTIPQMARSGFGLNVVGIVLTVVLTYALIIPIFDVAVGELPTWVGTVTAP